MELGRRAGVASVSGAVLVTIALLTEPLTRVVGVPVIVAVHRRRMRRVAPAGAVVADVTGPVHVPIALFARRLAGSRVALRAYQRLKRLTGLSCSVSGSSGRAM